ncbi:MmpS family transport accessory protein [Mycobacterium sp. 1245499.0]|uniref:MmpS family transport accessory protein n=1 Tax=Mycobacterium sp. 1245499.0 TaxID=1834074 RepID=UPI000A405D74|nr:MmpS family transport accessory protein [Mycobacterium sp. 1245499.0]
MGARRFTRRVPAMNATVGLVRRVWLPLLIVVAVAVGGVAVTKLRAVFGSNPILVAPNSSDSAADFNPKVVTYEVFGSAARAVINYLDLDGKPQRAPDVVLPWSLTLQTTAPAATPNLLAQGDGSSIACRITVDRAVRDERSVAGVNAMTFCLVKSA